MYIYYFVEAKFEGVVEILFGSYIKQECIDEIDAEKECWKSEGFNAFRLKQSSVIDPPDSDVYSASDIERNNKLVAAEIEFSV